MALETRSSAILRFGTLEVDLCAGELRKQGLRIKLQEQPFHVLTVLLQRPGEVVTREELRNQNWSPDTFVDFDNSLNTAINKLREALGDSADSPRFIETLPRRGYRFIVPVSSTDRAASPALAIGTRRWRVVLPLAVVLITAAAGTIFWRWRQSHRLTEKDTIVLGDFANSTADPVFDGTLREGLSVQLQQSPFLSLVSEEGIHKTLRMMGQPANARLTPEITREVCQRTNSTAALDGSIALIGTRYNLILKAVNCANGDLLASTEVQASDKSHVLDALSEGASEMRRRLGESLSSVQKYNTPLEQATTPSLEALQAYSLGLKTVGGGDIAGALALFQRATRLDPQFAMAYWGTSLVHGNLGESLLTIENHNRAFQLRESLSEREKLLLECDHFPPDIMAARRSCKLGTQIFPRDPFFPLDLGVYSNVLGQYEEGLKEYREALRLAPGTAFYYRNLALTYLLLNRDKEAAAIAQEARAKGADSDFLLSIRYGIAFYQNDPAEMGREAAHAANTPGAEDLLLAMEADTAAYFGHLGDARELSRRAAESAERSGAKETAAVYDTVSALREALFGNMLKAAEQFAKWRGRHTGHDLDYAFALALTYTSEADEARALVENLAKIYPDDLIVQFNYLPTIRAKLALSHAKSQDALEILKPAAPYELGLPALGFYNWPNLYPVYVRGEAYLAAHQGREAATEFQKILDHRGIVLNEPIGALAHLQLGRAYATQDDTVKARSAYQDFLTLWEDADADIPVLKRAKEEYAKL
jgi:DNA-binding winged helix-turn-helix (wHTH) protein/Flp pilus assembly protein TadD